MSANRTAALALLRDRAASIPACIRALGDGLAAGIDTAGCRAITTTGVGSSGAHARALASWLSDLGLRARFRPPSAFPAEHDARHADDLLVVFSQGLSPNIRWATTRLDAWHQVVVVTSTLPSAVDARGRFAESLRDAGVLLIDSGAPDEFGTLVRLAGPATGFWVAAEIVRAFDAGAWPRATEVADALERAHERGHALAEPVAAQLASEPVVWIAPSETLDAADNLRLKWTEGLFRAVPPVTDLLDFAHGPFQAIHDDAAVVLLLSRPAGAAAEAERRVRQLLTPRHTLVRLEARLEGPAAILEYEVIANALLLAALERSDLDPAHWPGKDADHALYSFGADVSVSSARPGGLALETASWPELEAALAAGRDTAILPLGSTEQHGPHLPFATDTWIADALGARLGRRRDDVVVLPALPLGAASEHMDFAGTLSLSEATLVGVLADIARSLAHHGFRDIFCFSAHGGNLRALREAEASLSKAAAPGAVARFHGPHRRERRDRTGRGRRRGPHAGRRPTRG